MHCVRRLPRGGITCDEGMKPRRVAFPGGNVSLAERLMLNGDIPLLESGQPYQDHSLPRFRRTPDGAGRASRLSGAELCALTSLLKAVP